MELDFKFQMCNTLTFGSLHPDHQYHFAHSERVNTRYVHSVLIPVLVSPTTSLKLFLPEQYSEVVSVQDIEDTNSKRVLLYLIYKRTSAKSNLYILELQRQQFS
jgi:hypothetical protein